MANFSHAIFVVKRTTDKDNDNRLTNKFHRFPHPRTWNDITFFGACSFDPFCTKQFPVLNNSIHQRHRGSAELNILVECDHRKRRTKTSSFFFLCVFFGSIYNIFFSSLQTNSLFFSMANSIPKESMCACVREFDWLSMYLCVFHVVIFDFTFCHSSVTTSGSIVYHCFSFSVLRFDDKLSYIVVLVECT